MQAGTLPARTRAVQNDSGRLQVSFARRLERVPDDCGGGGRGKGGGRPEGRARERLRGKAGWLAGWVPPRASSPAVLACESEKEQGQQERTSAKDFGRQRTPVAAIVGLCVPKLVPHGLRGGGVWGSERGMLSGAVLQARRPLQARQTAPSRRPQQPLGNTGPNGICLQPRACSCSAVRGSSDRHLGRLQALTRELPKPASPTSSSPSGLQHTAPMEAGAAWRRLGERAKARGSRAGAGCLDGAAGGKAASGGAVPGKEMVVALWPGAHTALTCLQSARVQEA